MFTNLLKPEDIRRVVNSHFDIEPTYKHLFDYQSSKRFIKGKIVLDIGCWTGQLERLAYKSAKKMFAIDSNPAAISFAKKSLPDVNFRVANANKLPFSNSYFDTVMLMDVIEHVPKGSEKEVFKQIHRVLKPGGNLILSTPHKHPLSILLDPAYFLLGHRHYSLKEISKLLSETGFKIQNDRLIGNSYGLIYANLSLLFKYTMGFEPQFLQNKKDFLLKEHSKEGFAFLFLIAEALK